MKIRVFGSGFGLGFVSGCLLGCFLEAFQGFFGAFWESWGHLWKTFGELSLQLLGSFLNCSALPVPLLRQVFFLTFEGSVS